MLNPEFIATEIQLLNEKILHERRKQIVEVLRLLQNSQLVSVVGENGSGKTKLIQEGIVPLLLEGFLGMDGKKWEIQTIRPGITPIENLANGLNRLIHTNQKIKLEEENTLCQKIKTSKYGIRSFLSNQKKNKGNKLLIIDNLEDLFYLEQVSNDSNLWESNISNFFNNIEASIQDFKFPIYYLFIIRIDFISKLFNYRRFYEHFSKSQYTIPNFKIGEFKEYLNKQLKTKEKTIDINLINYLFESYGRNSKNLEFLELLLTLEEKQKNILEDCNLEIIKENGPNKIYKDLLESFYEEKEIKFKEIFKKIIKQLIVGYDEYTLRKPVKITDLWKSINYSEEEINQVIFKTISEINFLFELFNPFEGLLEKDSEEYINKNTILSIKNEYFIPYWPRLLSWIEEEKNSKNTYTNLSEKAILYEKELTGYLRPPDLDYFIDWYEKNKPDSYWASQINPHFKKTINYLQRSKKQFEEELFNKEKEQKEKIKRIRKTGLYISLGALIISIIIGIIAIDAKKQELIAKSEKDKAQQERERATFEKIRADTLSLKARLAMEKALENEAFAISAQRIANFEYQRADSLRVEAELQKEKIEDAYSKLDNKTFELNKTVKELIITDSLRKLSTEEAINARSYQESINSILSLRNTMNNETFSKEDLSLIKEKIEYEYVRYKNASESYKGLMLPNNDLFQILFQTSKLLDNSEPENLVSMSNGIRDIEISKSGKIALGGDDGIILYSSISKVNTGSPIFESYKINNERIRSLKFIDNNSLILGTTSGNVFKFNTVNKELTRLNLNNPKSKFIEKIIYIENKAIILTSKEITIIDFKNGGTPYTISGINIENIFQFSSDEVLAISPLNETILLNVNNLQWRTITTDFPSLEISSLIINEDMLFLGLKNGNIYVGKKIKAGDFIKFNVEHIINVHQTRITNLKFDKSSKNLFTSSLDQKAIIFDLSLSQLGQEYIVNNSIKIEGFQKWIWDFEIFEENGDNILLTVDENGNLKKWSTSISTLFKEIKSKNL